MTKKKALIFYISRHSGHYHAASAIEKGLLATGAATEVSKINALSYTNPILGKLINKAYLRVIKKNPELWGNMYDNPSVMKKTKTAREALHRFNMSKIRKLIESYSPDIVYCTQAFPCGMVADYKRSCSKDLPLVGVLTDHAPHSYWLFDEVDRYVVPSEETAKVLEEKGVPPEKIRVYGIPVDPKFETECDTAMIRSSLGFKQGVPTILIMGGSQGLGALEAVVRSFCEDEEYTHQLMVVTGVNKKLQSRLNKLIKRKCAGNIRVFGQVENIEELMAISDVIVTKAGGMTIAESLAKTLPILVVDPIPGHERMNAEYLCKKGAAIEIKDIVRIHDRVIDVFRSKGTLDRMRQNIRKIAKKDSATNVAKLSFEL